MNAASSWQAGRSTLRHRGRITTQGLARCPLRWLLVIAALLLWAPFHAPAAAATASPAFEAQRPLLLAGSAPSHGLAGHLAVFSDPSRQMDLEDVRRAGPGAFVPLPGHLSAGFTPDVVWLRFVVDRRDTAQPELWWLVLSQALMQDARLYSVAADERPGQAAGSAAAPAQAIQARADRVPVFELPMPTPGIRTYYLRLQTQASMSLTATLWQPRAMAASTTKEAFLWGGMFGAYLLVIVFYLAFWVWTRERVHAIYVLYVLCNFLAALFTGGWLRQLWPGIGPEAMLLLLGIWITLALLVGSAFSMLLLGMHRRWPRLSAGLLKGCAVIAVAAIILVLAGHYQTVMPVVQTLSLVMIVGFFLVAVRLALGGDRAAWLFLGAFGFFYAGVTWRYLRNIGVLEPGFWNDNIYQLGAFVHMLVMSVGIFTRYGALRRKTEEAEARVAAEAGLRAQQRDFIAMVSHEFRTPLSIVSATTHNLLHNEQLSPPAQERVRKVIRANERMSSLMESYLTNERLLQDDTKPNLVACNLVEVCNLACRDLEELEGRPLVLSGSAQVVVDCDEDLIRIALNNLLTNAHRHSPPGAPVEVEVSASGGRARVCVRDRGAGIPPQDIAHVFKRFFRGRNALDSRGTGLGLYLVQVIASRHGGTVNVRNLAPVGCEFTLTLPLHQAPPPAGARRAPAMVRTGAAQAGKLVE